MYNNNDTITQGRNKAQKQSNDKKLHFKSMAASSFVGAMAGAGAMWAGEAFANEQIMRLPPTPLPPRQQEYKPLRSPTSRKLLPTRWPLKAKRKHSTRPTPRQRPMPQHTTHTAATPHTTMSHNSLRPLTRKDMPHNTTFKLKVSKP